MRSENRLLSVIATALFVVWSNPGNAEGLEITVVANPSTPVVNQSTVQRIFLGKMFEVGGVGVKPVNLPPGDPGRQAFMKLVMEEDDAKFIGYWTVRRYIGQGIPPVEVSSAAEMIDYIRGTPGAIGYIVKSVPTDGVIVIFRRP